LGPIAARRNNAQGSRCYESRNSCGRAEQCAGYRAQVSAMIIVILERAMDPRVGG
jgi:hypothetical protein